MDIPEAILSLRRHLHVHAKTPASAGGNLKKRNLDTISTRTWKQPSWVFGRSGMGMRVLLEVIVNALATIGSRRDQHRARGHFHVQDEGRARP
jgi:hypothetical protein